MRGCRRWAQKRPGRCRQHQQTAVSQGIEAALDSISSCFADAAQLCDSSPTCGARELQQPLSCGGNCFDQPHAWETCGIPMSAESQQANTQNKQPTNPNSALLAQLLLFDVAVVDSQWLTNTDKYRTFVSSFLSTALLPHVVLLLPLPLPASPPLVLPLFLFHLLPSKSDSTRCLYKA